jgi:hypothetical protein
LLLAHVVHLMLSTPAAGNATSCGVAVTVDDTQLSWQQQAG